MTDQKLPDDLWQKIRNVAAEEAAKAVRGIFRSASVTDGDFTVMGGGSVRVKDGGDVVVDPAGQMRSSDFDGDLPTRNPGTIGWAIDHDTAAFADLLLRPGSVGNDAVTNPVLPGYLFASGSNFALSTAMTNILTQNVTVPAGCTQLATAVTGRVFAYNSTAGLDYLYGQTNVAGFNGNALPLAVSAGGGSGTSISPFAVLLTGLVPGATVSFQMAAQTAFRPWAANTGNTVELSGLLLWFR